MQLTLLAFVILTTSACYSVKKASIYVDNGRDQTTTEELPGAVKLQLESEILTLLGVPRRPITIKDPLKRSTTKFLLGVYQALVAKTEDKSRLRRSVSGDLSEDEQMQVVESDTIITFEMDNVTSLGQKLGKALWFDLIEWSYKGITSVELKLYKSYTNLTSDYTVEAFEIISIEGKKELKLVSYVTVRGGYAGWLSLNITSSFRNWITDSSSAARIYVTSWSAASPTLETSLEELGVSCALKDETSPFVVVFLKAANVVDVRGVREVKVPSNSATNDWYSTEVNTWRRCRRHTLYVRFRDLQWQDWVIAPEGYDAHYCSGECLFPLKEETNATNHALVQSMMHILYPGRYHRPCCAPNELLPVTVLYFLSDGEAILKKYESMAVSGCGCQ